jgi:FkbM family methyltransferase
MHIGKVAGFKVYHRNPEEFSRLVDEIFVRKEYKFEALDDHPRIIDCGSHIGMSILYFKSLYPRAQITGFEPNLENFTILQKNLAENGVTDVQLINAALSNKNGTDILKTSKDTANPWTWGDTIIENLRGDDSVHRKVEVHTVKLSDYLSEPVDFLKIDVEGSEQRILEEIKDQMQVIHQIDLEFHDTETGRHVNNLETVIRLLEEGGFNVETTARDKKIVFADFAKYMRATYDVYCVKCAVKATRD